MESDNYPCSEDSIHFPYNEDSLHFPYSEEAEHNPYIEWDKEIIITQGDRMHHWHQDGKYQFITFRLADSLPQTLITELRGRMDYFLKSHPKPWDLATKRKYEDLVGSKVDYYLDQGYGECTLQYEQYRKYLSEALHYHDNRSYYLDGYVIMPNHVHMLVELIDDKKLEKIIQSIKQFSALRINRELRRSGAFWMRRYMERMGRSYGHYKYCMHYIEENPRYLAPWQYKLYLCPDWVEQYGKGG